MTSSPWTPGWASTYGAWSNWVEVSRAASASLVVPNLLAGGYTAEDYDDYQILTGPGGPIQKRYWIYDTGGLWEGTRSIGSANLEIVQLAVPGFADRYVRLPVGAADDVANLISQGSPATWNEVVGEQRNTADVYYAQDKSALVDSSRYDDYDNRPARWAVSYEDDGLLAVRVNDGRLASNAVSLAAIPSWALVTAFEENVTDAKSGRNVRAPSGYRSDTASLSNEVTART